MVAEEKNIVGCPKKLEVAKKSVQLYLALRHVYSLLDFCELPCVIAHRYGTSFRDGGVTH